MRKYLFLLGSVVFSSPALAQDGPPLTTVEYSGVPTLDLINENTITVTASGVREPLAETGQPVTVIGADEIEQVQGGDLTRVLERLPGVTLSRNGGVGNFTGLRVRGADAEQLLVLVDGVRVADTASPANGFDFGTLLPGGIGKIELLRGSNSTIWGSQAMGGVMAVTTLSDDSVRGSVEYGGPESVYAQGSAGHDFGALKLGVDGAYFDNEGISSAAIGSEPDGFRQWQAGAHARVALGDSVNLRAAVRHLDARLDLDGFPPPTYSTFDDTGEYQDTARTSGSAGIDYNGDRLTLGATWSLSDTQRESYDPSFGSDPSYTTHGREDRAELRGKWDITDAFDLHFGAEREWSWMETLFDSRTHSKTTGAYAQAGFKQGPVVLNAGLRIDDHDRFGTAWSFGADGAIELGGGWRARASYGEGFKAPSLFQLLSDYGNTLLRPERSHGFDAGIELNGRSGGGPFFSLSAFRRDSTDLIDFISCAGVTDGICTDRPNGTYDNIGKVRAQGVEIEGGYSVFDTLQLQAAYSYVEAKNCTPGAANEGNDLARRPRHAVTLSADWETPLAGLQLGADLRVVSHSFDDPGNFTRLDGYQLVTIRASFPLTDEVELYGRVENLFDENYQTTAGFGTPGRGAYIGARARF